MRLFEIINEISFDSLEIAFVASNYKYEKYKDDYKKMFLELRNREPELNNEFEIIIDKEFNEDDEENDTFYYYAHSYNILEKQHYGLMLTSWNEWLGMNIAETTLEKYSYPEIVMHCMGEMTYFGFNEESLKEEVAELDRRVKSIEDGTAKLIPFEDVIKNIFNK